MKDKDKEEMDNIEGKEEELISFFDEWEFEDDIDSKTKSINFSESHQIIYKKTIPEEKIKKALEGLNEDQVEAILGIIDYILNNEDSKDYYLIQGSGGVGKSFAIARALTLLSGYNIIAAAPSHFAKNVLDSNIIENGVTSVTVYTVAALMGKKLTSNSKGELILVNNKGIPPIAGGDIIVVDEVSMIDDETSKELIEMCKYKKLLVLGDYCQLPPVKQDTDNIFFNEISTELNIPMRFEGHLYKMASIIRAEINKAREGYFADINIINKSMARVSMIGEDGSGYVFTSSFETFIKAALRRFRENKGSFHVRILAYRNKTIDKINEIIRKDLYGFNAKQFEDDELVINEGGYKTYINNGEILTIKSVRKVEGPYNIPCVTLKFRDKKINIPVYVVSTEGKEMYDRVLQKKKAAAKKSSYKWKEYYAFIDSFAYFKYSYSSSVHKAQGSTITHVFILDDDILSIRPITSKEKLQSLYVAVTRARFRAVIFNKKYKVDQSKLITEYLKKNYEE